MVSVTTLMENTVYAEQKGLTCEHGLSFLIERDGQKVLFDTGQTGAFCDNARRMGIGFSDVDTVVLSHGHYDHAGGLARLAQERAGGFTVVAHPAALLPKCCQRSSGYTDIGMPISRQQLARAGAVFRPESSPAAIAPGMTFTGEIPMITDFETTEPIFFSRKGDALIPDTFADDAALVLETGKGIAVVLGCAHRGVLNTLHHVRAITGEQKIYAIMGGLHLNSASDEKLKKIAAGLKDFDVQMIGAGHCTGSRATSFLADLFRGRTFPIGVGARIEF